MLLNFIDFLRKQMLTEAFKGVHYECRKKFRLDTSVYTAPKFSMEKFKNKIDLIENTTFPKNKKIFVRIKLDTKYINTYQGGECPEDKSDISNGSHGNFLYFLIENNFLVTLFFGNVGYKTTHYITDENLKDIVDIIGNDISKINFDIPVILTLKNLRNKKISSKYHIKIKSKNYYYHPLYNGNEDILINDYDYLPINLYDLKDDEFDEAITQLAKYDDLQNLFN